MGRSLLATSLLASAAHAATHQILIGSTHKSYIYAIEYDDSAKTLTELANNTAAEPHQWISFNHDKRILYGSAGNSTTGLTVSTYTVENATSIHHNATTAANSNSVTGSVYVEASPVEPYAVYACAYQYIYGGVAGVDETGVTTEQVQGFTYDNASSLHGVRVHPSGDYVYTADMWTENGSLWTHKIDRTTGAVSFVARATSDSGNLRHLEISPSGKYAYVMAEDSSRVVVFDINNATGAATYSGVAYDLVPEGAAGTHRGETTRLSATGTLLYATTRANKSDANALDGFVSGFTLDADGAVVSQDFVVATTTGGGSSNMVVPATWDDNLFGIIDGINGWFIMWERNADGAGATPLATIEVGGGDPSIANGQWLF